MRKPLVIAVPALVFALLCGLDVAREPQPWDLAEIGPDIAEKAVLLALVVAVAWSVLRVQALREESVALRDHLERAGARGEAWRAARAREVSAMGAAIAEEFGRWGLTPAEADIAQLLLKGASMKEIALARDTAEATIRQQAQGLYRKAGLSGRAELSAYFLDSLFAAVEPSRPVPLRPAAS